MLESHTNGRALGRDPRLHPAPEDLRLAAHQQGLSGSYPVCITHSAWAKANTPAVMKVIETNCSSSGETRIARNLHLNPRHHGKRQLYPQLMSPYINWLGPSQQDQQNQAPRWKLFSVYRGATSSSQHCSWEDILLMHPDGKIEHWTQVDWGLKHLQRICMRVSSADSAW